MKRYLSFFALSCVVLATNLSAQTSEEVQFVGKAVVAYLQENYRSPQYENINFREDSRGQLHGFAEFTYTADNGTRQRGIVDCYYVRSLDAALCDYVR